ncbi:hypothetical protein FRC03_002635 [Tulasnella sp. 419]|nr:hypothetical protein FRC02_000883 [Tulasnella sp. 418]KAG8963735.1 hypothetical protein FRC03_002635 [Tulasnella sp. 419]
MHHALIVSSLFNILYLQMRLTVSTYFTTFLLFIFLNGPARALPMFDYALQTACLYVCPEGTPVLVGLHQASISCPVTKEELDDNGKPKSLSWNIYFSFHYYKRSVNSGAAERCEYDLHSGLLKPNQPGDCQSSMIHKPVTCKVRKSLHSYPDT